MYPNFYWLPNLESIYIEINNGEFTEKSEFLFNEDAEILEYDKLNFENSIDQLHELVFEIMDWGFDV